MENINKQQKVFDTYLLNNDYSTARKTNLAFAIALPLLVMVMFFVWQSKLPQSKESSVAMKRVATVGFVLVIATWILSWVISVMHDSSKYILAQTIFQTILVVSSILGMYMYTIDKKDYAKGMMAMTMLMVLLNLVFCLTSPNNVGADATTAQTCLFLPLFMSTAMVTFSGKD